MVSRIESIQEMRQVLSFMDQIKMYARKSIYHGCAVWIEKSVTRDHCSATLGKPRDADQ